MIPIEDDLYFYDNSTPWSSGQATTLPVAAPDDVVAKLHAVVEEVTRKPVVKPDRPRMGFL